MTRPRLSVCCFSGSPLSRTAVILSQLRGVADEIVCAVDGDAPEEGVASVLGVADRVIRCEFDRSTGIERHLAWLHGLCSGEWILRIDNDEVPSSTLIAALPHVVRSHDVLTYVIDRRWLWPDQFHYLNESPWRFDWQIRLVRNEPRMLRFSGEMHSSADLVMPFRYLDASIYHLDCVANGIIARRRKAEYYEEQRPGM